MDLVSKKITLGAASIFHFPDNSAIWETCRSNLILSCNKGDLKIILLELTQIICEVVIPFEVVSPLLPSCKLIAIESGQDIEKLRCSHTSYNLVFVSVGIDIGGLVHTDRN